MHILQVSEGLFLPFAAMTVHVATANAGNTKLSRCKPMRSQICQCVTYTDTDECQQCTNFDHPQKYAFLHLFTWCTRDLDL